MVREETDEETNDLKTRQCMARYVEARARCIETQINAKWIIKKPKLDNSRSSRGIFFTELDDEELKRTMKTARTKIGHSDASSNAL